MGSDEQEVERLQADPEPRAAQIVSSEGAPLLDNASRWEHAVRLQDVSLPLYVATTMPTRLDPADWNTGFLSVYERELPPQLFSDLRELTPQALLRDLHRPVQDFPVTLGEHEGSAVVGRWREVAADFRSALQREPPPIIEPSLHQVRDEQRRRREFLDEEWKPLLADDAPRREVQLYPDRGDEEGYE